MLPVEDLKTTFADADDDPRIESYARPFQKKPDGPERLVARLIERLCMATVRRMNPKRPLAALEDDEGEAMCNASYFFGSVSDHATLGRPPTRQPA